jgi:hypothetical protein
VQTPVSLERLQAEKDELNWLLTSGVLGRSSNLARMLTFVCEKHFQGADDQITEYSIATEALGRRDLFDPQDDTIVRVTAHSLRKRLQEIYQTDGVHRPVHIQIPLGNYLPSFVHEGADGVPAAEDTPASDSSLGQTLPDAHLPDVKPRSKRPSLLLAAAILAAIFLLCGYYFFAHRNATKTAVASAPGLPAQLQPKNTIRALM